MLQDCENAINHFQRHLEISISIGDRADEGRAYGNLGSVYQVLERYGEAIEYHMKDLTITQEIGDRSGELESLINLGQTYVR